MPVNMEQLYRGQRLILTKKGKSRGCFSAEEGAVCFFVGISGKYINIVWDQNDPLRKDQVNGNYDPKDFHISAGRPNLHITVNPDSYSNTSHKELAEDYRRLKKEANEIRLSLAKLGYFPIPGGLHHKFRKVTKVADIVEEI